MANALKLFALRQAARLIYCVRKIHDLFWKSVADLVELTLSEEQAAAWTRFHYSSRSGQYVHNGYNNSGLYDWERRAIDDYFPKSPARILLTAAGGGREAIALAQLGYEVVALEPEEQFYFELTKACAGDESLTAMQTSHEQLIATPPTDLPCFDGVVIGWGSFSHLPKRDEVYALMETLQGLCPKGPILTSFFVRQPPHQLSRSRQRLRQFIKSWSPIKRTLDGYLRFDYRLGLVRTYDQQWLDELAAHVDCHVTTFEPYPYGHAVLVPNKNTVDDA